MRILNWLRKKEKNSEMKEVQPKLKEIDYHSLIDVTKILTDNNLSAVEDITMLVEEPKKFEKLHSDWLGEVDFSPETVPDVITAYWLTGGNIGSPHDFGGYIDWKEETSEIICSLETSIQNKKYPIDLNEIEFSGEEFTDEALFKINQYLNTKGFVLLYWDNGGDDYHLYVIHEENLKALMELGQAMDLKFKTSY